MISTTESASLLRTLEEQSKVGRGGTLIVVTGAIAQHWTQPLRGLVESSVSLWSSPASQRTRSPIGLSPTMAAATSCKRGVGPSVAPQQQRWSADEPNRSASPGHSRSRGRRSCALGCVRLQSGLRRHRGHHPIFGAALLSTAVAVLLRRLECRCRWPRSSRLASS